MGRLFAYVRRYRIRYAVGLVCLGATASLAMTIPLLLKWAIDAIATDGTAPGVAPYAIAIVGIASIQGVVRTFSRALIFNVGRDIEYDIRNDLFAKLTQLSQGFYQRERTGDLMSRVINDVTAVRMMLGPGILNLVNTPIYYAYGLSIMLALDAPLTLLALLPYPIVLWIVRLSSRRIFEHTLRVQDGLARMTSHIQEHLSGLHVVRAYAMEPVQARAFAQLNQSFRDESLKLARIRGQIVPMMRIAAGTGTIVVLWYGGSRVISGQLGVGDLVAFLAYLNLLAWPTMALGWMISVIQRGRAAMQRLEDVLASTPEVRDTVDVEPLAEVRGAIEFDRVQFAYDSGHPVLENLSFSVTPGERLAIVGRTGSGKTSIASLLSRHFDVTSGTIRLDGRDIRSIPLKQLRTVIAIVPQDPFLFSASIADNLRFAHPEATPDEVTAVARAAGVARDVEAFRDGYATQVGERGITLSGGQKQRITLARALLANPRVIVLDDALSSVDVRTEEEVLTAFDTALRGRTTLLISHRISSVRTADRIIVLDQGRIVESGDHDTLVAANGVYAEVFRQQSLEAGSPAR